MQDPLSINWNDVHLEHTLSAMRRDVILHLGHLLKNSGNNQVKLQLHMPLQWAMQVKV
jgi:hypothetical protein